MIHGFYGSSSPGERQSARFIGIPSNCRARALQVPVAQTAVTDMTNVITGSFVSKPSYAHRHKLLKEKRRPRISARPSSNTRGEEEPDQTTVRRPTISR